MDFKDLNLTDEELKLIVDGLDALAKESPKPGQDTAGVVLGVINDLEDEPNEFKAKKLKDEISKQFRDATNRKEHRDENIRILQGRILMFKRQQAEEAALKMTNDILGKS